MWFVWIGGLPLVVAYAIGAPGLLYLYRRQVIPKAAWTLPLFTLVVWWVLFLSGFGSPESYNVFEAFLVACALAVSLDLLAVFLLARRGVIWWSNTLLWVLPLVFVVVLRLAMPPLGE
ncbi:MAG: hypothetical protein K2X00_17185 [Nitrospiraceae bacterium]|nr:hypothetical protein [Nitrospiraceae bacterium]